MKKTLLVCLSVVFILSCKLMDKEEKKDEKADVSLPYTKFSVAEDGYGEVDG